MIAKLSVGFLGIGFALLFGMALLVGGTARQVSAASGPTVFSIAPGDAERVPLDRDDGVCTLAEAVEAANDQGVSNPPLNDCGSASVGLNVIQLQAGSYDLTTQVSVINGGNTATFNIVTPISVQGVTSDTTTIRRTDAATDQFRFFHVGGNGVLTLDDLTLTGGYANGGTGGGAVHVFGSGVFTMTNTSLISNTARFGGALYNAGIAGIVSSSIVDNSASENDSSQGGGIYNTNRLTLAASNVTSNRSTQHGGGIYISGTGSGAAQVIASSITFNQSNSDLSDVGNGGGIYHASGTLTVTLSTLASNDALPEVPTLDASNGGGLFVADRLDMNLTLVNGNAASNGAGLYQDAPGTSAITRTLFLNNLAVEAGAGIYNKGDLALDNTVVWANVAAQGNGAGLHNETLNGRTANIRNSTFYVNIATAGSGGGIYNVTDGGSWTSLSNVTVADNEASEDGGGISNGQQGQIVVASSTLANNVAGGGGGGISSSDPITEHVRVRNTILTGNTSSNTGATGNCDGRIQSQGYNLESMTSCSFNASGDLGPANADLDSLAPADPMQVLAGNITPAFNLMANSEAFNAGNPAGCYDALNVNNNDLPLLIDQWGAPRVRQGRCDIGSIEGEATTAVTTVALHASSQQAPQLTWWLLPLLAAIMALLAS